AHEDRAALEGVVRVELAAPVVERAHEGVAAERAVGAVDERLAPLVRLRVVEKQRQTLPVAFRSVDLDLLELGAAVPERAHDDEPVHLDGLGRLREGMKEALDLRVPDTDVEVEVVPAVAKRRGGGGRDAQEERSGEQEAMDAHGSHLAAPPAPPPYAARHDR